jgi:hypothetical protein
MFAVETNQAGREIVRVKETLEGIPKLLGRTPIPRANKDGVNTLYLHYIL